MVCGCHRELAVGKTLASSKKPAKLVLTAPQASYDQQRYVWDS
jgi:hypothetical protein